MQKKRLKLHTAFLARSIEPSFTFKGPPQLLDDVGDVSRKILASFRDLARCTQSAAERHQLTLLPRVSPSIRSNVERVLRCSRGVVEVPEKERRVREGSWVSQEGCVSVICIIWVVSELDMAHHVEL